jgi:hypothetical protein
VRLFTRGWDILHSRVLPVPSPERSLVTTITDGARQIDVASLALPPARNAWGKPAKNRQAVVFADWAEQRTLPTIFGIDGNTPEIDHPEHAASKFFQANEPWFLGPPPSDHEEDPQDDRAVHDLRTHSGRG